MGHVHQHRPRLKQEHGTMQQDMALGNSLCSVITMFPVEGQDTQINMSPVAPWPLNAIMVLGDWPDPGGNIMALGGNRSHGHQSDPEQCRAMNPYTAKGCSLDPYITVASAKASQISTAPATARPSDTNTTTDHGLDPRFPYGLW